MQWFDTPQPFEFLKLDPDTKRGICKRISSLPTLFNLSRTNKELYQFLECNNEIWELAAKTFSIPFDLRVEKSAFVQFKNFYPIDLPEATISLFKGTIILKCLGKNASDCTELFINYIPKKYYVEEPYKKYPENYIIHYWDAQDNYNQTMSFGGKLEDGEDRLLASDREAGRWIKSTKKKITVIRQDKSIFRFVPISLKSR